MELIGLPKIIMTKVLKKSMVMESHPTRRFGTREVELMRKRKPGRPVSVDKHTRKLEVLKALKKPKYWNPNYSSISKDLNLPVSTVFDVIKTLKEEGRFIVSNIQIFSDLQAYERRKRK